jgi:type II secretory pathway predicted ATPase ExeA
MPIPSVDDTVVATVDPRPFDDRSPRRPWLGKVHRDAVTALVAGVHAREPIVLLTGDARSGKSVVTGVVLDCIAAAGREVAAVSADDLGAIEGLRDVVATGRATGVPVALAVDDAHALTPEAFQVLVALLGPPSPTARGRRGDVTVLLTGDYGLYSVLREAEGRLLAAIRTTVHLRALSADEVADYIGERLRDASVSEQNFFTPAALQAIAAWSGGLPGAVNALCASALDEVSRRRSLPTESTVIAECARNLGWSADEDDLAATVALETAHANGSSASTRRFVPGPRTLKAAAVIAGIALVGAGSVYSARRSDGQRPLVERALVVAEPTAIPVSSREAVSPPHVKAPPPVSVSRPEPRLGAGAGTDAQKERAAAGVAAAESLSASPVLTAPAASRAKPAATSERRSRLPEVGAPSASTAAPATTHSVASPKTAANAQPAPPSKTAAASAQPAAASSPAAKAQPSAAPKREAAPARTEAAEDSGAIIDWLLKEYVPPR